MLALSSAHRLATRSGRRLILDWTPEWACGAEYKDVFDEPDFALPNRHHLTEGPRREEVFFTALKISHIVDVIHAKPILHIQAYWPLRDKSEEDKAFQFERYLRMLRPVPTVAEMAMETVDKAKGDCSRLVGIHVRRTDHSYAIYASPTDQFIRKIKTFARKPGTGFLICTDCPKTEQEIRVALRPLGAKITAPVRTSLERDTPEGARNALAEMIALSKTSDIIGSQGSSFSWIASMLNNTPLHLVSRKALPSAKKAQRAEAAARLSELMIENPGMWSKMAKVPERFV